MEIFIIKITYFYVDRNNDFFLFIRCQFNELGNVLFVGMNRWFVECVGIYGGDGDPITFPVP